MSTQNAVLPAHVVWAQGHDWFKYAAPDRKGQWSVVVRDPKAVFGERVFTDYQALREWAGY